MLAHHPLITASDRLYFAYGSNLSPEQMARRCPDSIFLGKATLRGHRWQINERGVANLGPVVPAVPAAGSKAGSRGRSRGGDNNSRDKSEDAVVEGLIYAISVADERQLDSYEGVAKGRYDKFEVQVDFEPVRENVFARCTSASVARAVRDEREAAGGVVDKRRTRSRGDDDREERRRREHHPRDGGRRGASVGSSSSSSSSASVAASGLKNSILELFGIPSRAGRAPSPSPAPRGERGRERVGGKPVLALVYASTVCVRDGDIKERYVPRMERAMADAVALGVSKRFVEKQMAPRVLGARPAGRSSRRMSLAGGGRDSPEREKGRREGEDAKRRSVSQPDGSGRRGRRDSVVLDRHRDY